MFPSHDSHVHPQIFCMYQIDHIKKPFCQSSCDFMCDRGVRTEAVAWPCMAGCHLRPSAYPCMVWSQLKLSPFPHPL